MAHKFSIYRGKKAIHRGLDLSHIMTLFYTSCIKQLPHSMAASIVHILWLFITAQSGIVSFHPEVHHITLTRIIGEGLL